MGKFIITEQTSREILQRLESVEALLQDKQKNPQEVFFDSQEFNNIMNISKRTAQAWREQKVVAYSQIGNKIYYRLSDIILMLEKFKVPAIR
ncbi:MAG: helix-turn-helix domain-containing protein [Bacteroidota bacterium]|nr:helix-turn-helix domain-containing protein [Bacteroidota bacterium]